MYIDTHVGLELYGYMFLAFIHVNMCNQHKLKSY